MRIDQNLNLVVPIERESGTIYVHSTPISPAVFETYFLEIGKAFAAIMQQGLGIHAGPRVAYLMLKRISEASGTWAGQGGVEHGLMNEIRRLSNVAMPGEKGWHAIPLEDALKRKYLDPEDIAEAEGAIVFFILVSAMIRKMDRAEFLERACGLWRMQVVSLNCTAYAASLETSTETEPFTETVKASSLPS
jgi:hypothetical protein